MKSLSCITDFLSQPVLAVQRRLSSGVQVVCIYILLAGLSPSVVWAQSAGTLIVVQDASAICPPNTVSPQGKLGPGVQHASPRCLQWVKRNYNLSPDEQRQMREDFIKGRLQSLNAPSSATPSAPPNTQDVQKSVPSTLFGNQSGNPAQGAPVANANAQAQEFRGPMPRPPGEDVRAKQGERQERLNAYKNATPEDRQRMQERRQEWIKKRWGQ